MGIGWKGPGDVKVQGWKYELFDSAERTIGEDQSICITLPM